MLKQGWLRLSVIVASVLIPLHSAYSGEFEAQSAQPFRYVPRVSLGAFYQGDQFSNGAFGLFDAFVPFTINPNAIVFLDGRYIDRDQSSESNVGLGFRDIMANGHLLWSLYSFFDNRRTRFNNRFSQVTVGAELQTQYWFLNANGYIPVGVSEQIVSSFNTAYLCEASTRICYAAGIEKSMGGWDAELGRTLYGGLKAYLGVYRFSRSGVKTALGPKLRVQYDIQRSDKHRLLWLFNKVALIGNWRHDNLVGSSWYVGARFDITLGKGPVLTGLQQKMTSFIRRDINIVMSSDAKTPLHQPVQFLRNDADGKVTQVDVVSDANGLDAAASNSNINLIGVVGTITPNAVARTLSDNQILEGGIYAFSREGQNFSVQVGRQGGFAQAGAGHIFLVGLNNTIEHLSFNQSIPAVGDDVVGNPANTGVGNLLLRGNSLNGGDLIEIVLGTATSTSTVNVLNNTVVNGGVAGATNQDIIDLISSSTTGTLNAVVQANSITGNPAATDQRALNLVSGDGTTTLRFTDNVFTMFSQNQYPTVMLSAASSSNRLITVLGDMSGNRLTSTGGSAFTAQGSVTFQGGIVNNVFIGNRGTGGTVFGVFNLQTIQMAVPATANGSVAVNGSISGNTFQNLSAVAGARAVQIYIRNSAGAGHQVNLLGGFIDNTVITAGDGNGFFIDGASVGGPAPQSDIRGFYNNQFQVNAGVGISSAPNGSGISLIQIGGGATAGTQNQLAAQLAQLNKTSYVAGGTGTTTLSP